MNAILENISDRLAARSSVREADKHTTIRTAVGIVLAGGEIDEDLLTKLESHGIEPEAFVQMVDTVREVRDAEAFMQSDEDWQAETFRLGAEHSANIDALDAAKALVKELQGVCNGAGVSLSNRSDERRAHKAWLRNQKAQFPFFFQE